MLKTTRFLFLAKYDQQWYRNFYGRYLTAFVMIGLVLGNVLFFICQILYGDLLTDKGALDTYSVYSKDEWYRLITATFLHADISHIISNMVGLFFLGGLIEISVGHLGFALIYLLSGIGGNAVSVLYEKTFMIDRYSVGASGGVYGLIGAVLVLSIYERIRQKSEGESKGTTGNLVYRGAFVVIFMVASGFSEQNINNAAHIGGLVIGMLVSFILVLILRKKIKPMDL